jgi:hypothetical protein
VSAAGMMYCGLLKDAVSTTGMKYSDLIKGTVNCRRDVLWLT